MCYRFQYIELAYYITHGNCVGLEDPGDAGWVLASGDSFEEPEGRDHTAFNEFQRKSSKELNVQERGIHSKEQNFGSRVKIAPGYTDEHRIFQYMDEQVCPEYYTVTQKNTVEKETSSKLAVRIQQ